MPVCLAIADAGCVPSLYNVKNIVLSLLENHNCVKNDANSLVIVFIQNESITKYNDIFLIVKLLWNSFHRTTKNTLVKIGWVGIV